LEASRLDCSAGATITIGLWEISRRSGKPHQELILSIDGGAGSAGIVSQDETSKTRLVQRLAPGAQM
jgi:hypothetical protein